jgi:hypothetical protein
VALVSLQEAARIFGVSHQTIRRRLRDGTLQGHKVREFGGEADDKWPPDFDDNQVVNVLDLNEVLPPHFGMTSSSPGWDPRHDLVVDGVINILDVNMTLPPFFGQTCTP